MREFSGAPRLRSLNLSGHFCCNTAFNGDLCEQTKVAVYRGARGRFDALVEQCWQLEDAASVTMGDSPTRVERLLGVY